MGKITFEGCCVIRERGIGNIGHFGSFGNIGNICKIGNIGNIETTLWRKYLLKGVL